MIDLKNHEWVLFKNSCEVHVTYSLRYMGAEAAHALPRPYTSMHSRLKAILVMLKLVYDAINLRPRVEHEYSSSRMDHIVINRNR